MEKEDSANRIIFTLDDETCKELHIYAEGAALSILSDGRAILTGNRYDPMREEYHETVLHYYEKKHQIIEMIDHMLTSDPCGPGGRPEFRSYSQVVAYLAAR